VLLLILPAMFMAPMRPPVMVVAPLQLRLLPLMVMAPLLLQPLMVLAPLLFCC
jgi:hypothetical protein